MKFSTVVSVLAVAVASVSARAHAETNAARLARGLPPNPPARRGYPTESARRGRPSGTSGGQCNVGKLHCCNSVTSGTSQHANLLATLLGIVVDPTALVGTTCSPLSVAGIGGTSCNAQPVCCTDNHFNGLIVVGCTPININL